MAHVPAPEEPRDVIVAAAPTRAVVVTGADRASYLDAVLSQQLAGLGDGAVRGWLELDQHGAPRSAGELVALDDRILLLVDAALADELVDRLGGRTFLADATFARDPRTVLAVRGGRAAEVVARVFGQAPDEERALRVDDVALVGTTVGIDIVTPDAERDRGRLEAAGAEAVGADELERWRIRAGVPRWGAEIAPPHLPEELGLLPTHVHLAKGCYPGQEAVARMWMLGRPRRRLARVRVEGALPAGWSAGTGRGRATLTSVEGAAGLAFVAADTDAGERIEGEGGAIEVLAFVGSDRPVRGHDPKVTRRRDRAAG